MSVQTDAMEKIERAKDHIDQAAKLLSEVVVNRTWGWEDFNDTYKLLLRQTLNKLLELFEDLG